ncbi:ABC transporter ATP-binding protein [Flavobacteriaceae bacterium]|nr:ABC transporter ATP-binding protein [Flavobacteriaceae bacterium]
MISKIRIFIKLSNTLSNVLNKDEKNKFFRYLILSVINTFLEIVSISVIILMLFVISGQDVSRSKFNFLFEFLPFTKSIQNLAFLMISIIIFKTAYQIIFNYNQEKISYNIARRVNISLYKKFINSKYIDYANKSSADVIRLLNQEAVRLGNQIISPLITVINEMFLIIFIISYIFFYDISLGVMFLFVSIILLLVFNFLINKTVKKLGQEVTTSNTARIKLVNETYKAFDTIKLLNKQASFSSKFEKITNTLTDVAFKNIFFLKLPKSIFELIIFILVFILIIALDRSNNQDLLISYLSVSAVTIYKVIPSLNKLTNAIQGIQYFSVPFQEIINYLKINEEKEITSKLNNFKTIQFKKIHFNYKKDVILNDIDFTIKKNDFIGIYGPSGSGKSTLIKIIIGLIEPVNGEILLNNKLVNSFELRNQCSYVPQDSIILDEDIFTNVSLEFDKSKIDRERVISALDKVDLLEKFKNNLTDSLGDSGIKISGGQKQRIGIARALFNNRSLLILDESTSNLDSKVEDRIVRILEKLSNEITIIIISHNMSSLKKCKSLYEINRGKINYIK